MGRYSEKERSCEISFAECMPCWHAYTNGRNTPILFATDADMALVMNIIAQAAYDFTDKVVIIAFEVMNNHLHFVVSGKQTDIEQMLAFVIKRVRRSFGIRDTISVSFKPIDDLTSMRNHIVYVHRNGYVANPDYTPFSYPWGTGAFYYMPERGGKCFNTITSVENRVMFRSRDVKLPSEWLVIDVSSHNTLYLAPSSYCSTKLGMSMFRDAHHYFSAVSKNVEAYSGIAVELDDDDFLSDQEAFAQQMRIVRERYGVASIRELTSAQKLDLARTLHYDFRSSNGQIRRLLGLSEFEIAAIFPSI